MSIDIYSGQNPLEIPLYTYADASRYLGIAPRTVAYWARGGVVTGSEGERKRYEPVLATPGERGLSFLDLVELHALKALRQVHNVRLENVRRALRFAEDELALDERLLLNDTLSAHGGDVFIDHLGDIVNLSKSGQIALRDVIERSLQRIERDENLVPVKLYPDYRGVEDIQDEKPVVIDPRVSFGKPTVTGTGIRTGVIVNRIDAGESVDEVALDYGLSPEVVRSVILYEAAA